MLAVVSSCVPTILIEPFTEVASTRVPRGDLQIVGDSRVTDAPGNLGLDLDATPGLVDFDPDPVKVAVSLASLVARSRTWLPSLTFTWTNRSCWRRQPRRRPQG